MQYVCCCGTAINIVTSYVKQCRPEATQVCLLFTIYTLGREEVYRGYFLVPVGLGWKYSSFVKLFISTPCSGVALLCTPEDRCVGTGAASELPGPDLDLYPLPSLLSLQAKGTWMSLFKSCRMGLTPWLMAVVPFFKRSFKKQVAVKAYSTTEYKKITFIKHRKFVGTLGIDWCVGAILLLQKILFTFPKCAWCAVINSGSS